MPSLPPLDIKTKINHAPHVVILGAGASLAAFPNGDRNGSKLPLMRNLVEVIGLEDVLVAHGINENIENFEALFDSLASDPSKNELRTILEERVRKYFSLMQIPDQVTIYDLMLLSLREKDVIATFNWDPFLAQAFARNRKIKRLPRILFLHGNVEVGVCQKHRTKGFLNHHCSVCGDLMTPTSLLFPVKQKDYTSDLFINGEWEELQRLLERAYLVTIFGYSAPVTDVEAREILLRNWMSNQTRELAEIDIVDIRPRDDVKKSWSDFIVRQHYGIFEDIRRTLSFRHPRRSCEAFAMATLQQSPWHENDFPQTISLDKVHQWLEPLLAEEEAGYLSGKKCSNSIG